MTPLNPALFHEGSPEQISQTVVAAVAETKGIDPIDLTSPLYEVIDPDALDSLFQTTDGRGRVEFLFDGCYVIVEGNGNVRVERRTTPDGIDASGTVAAE